MFLSNNYGVNIDNKKRNDLLKFHFGHFSNPNYNSGYTVVNTNYNAIFNALKDTFLWKNSKAIFYLSLSTAIIMFFIKSTVNEFNLISNDNLFNFLAEIDEANFSKILQSDRPLPNFNILEKINTDIVILIKLKQKLKRYSNSTILSKLITAIAKPQVFIFVKNNLDKALSRVDTLINKIASNLVSE
jgi:hypothetical protein